MTIDTVVYYFEEFHSKEFEEISPASSSETAIFYFLLIRKIIDPDSSPFDVVKSSKKSTDDQCECKKSLGTYGDQLNEIIRMDVNNRTHLSKIIKAIGKLLNKNEEKFKVELKSQHRLNKLSNECYRFAKAVEHDITYKQACDPAICHQLDIQKQRLKLQHQYQPH